MHLISLGMAVIPRRNEKTKVMQMFGGRQIRCIMGNVKVGFSENLVVNISVRKIMLEEKYCKSMIF